tara:strand:- start:253 stop:552 length:300 start_codon:yes stop_codon:yes gene_type:complete
MKRHNILTTRNTKTPYDTLAMQEKCRKMTLTILASYLIAQQVENDSLLTVPKPSTLEAISNSFPKDFFLENTLSLASVFPYPATSANVSQNMNKKCDYG